MLQTACLFGRIVSINLVSSKRRDLHRRKPLCVPQKGACGLSAIKGNFLLLNQTRSMASFFAHCHEQKINGLYDCFLHFLTILVFICGNLHYHGLFRFAYITNGYYNSKITKDTNLSKHLMTVKALHLSNGRCGKCNIEKVFPAYLFF